MITGSVSSKELSAEKGLRAGDYLIDPARMTNNLLKAWLRDTGLDKLFKTGTGPVHQLRAHLVNAIRIAYERGQKSQAIVSKELLEKVAKLEAIEKVWDEHFPVEGLEGIVENNQAPPEYRALVKDMIEVMR